MADSLIACIYYANKSREKVADFAARAFKGLSQTLGQHNSVRRLCLIMENRHE